MFWWKETFLPNQLCKILADVKYRNLDAKRGKSENKKSKTNHWKESNFHQ